MAISDPITDPIRLVVSTNTTPPPISLRVAGESFDRVVIDADGIKVGDGTAAPTQVIDVTADSTLPDGVDIAVGSTTGTKIGTATTQKLGFFNASPVVQRSAWTQTYSTANKTVANPTAATPAATAAAPAALTATTITSPDGSDAASTQTLANELKADFNLLHADVTAIRAEVVKLVTDIAATNAEVTKLVADDLDNRQSITALIDDEQALGFAA